VLLSQFLAQDLHFAISLFAALVFFAVFWLYFDAWTNKKQRQDIYKWLGALLISISFLIHSTLIEQSVLGKSIFGNTAQIAANIIRLLGYLGMILGQLTEPLQKEPDVKGLTEDYVKGDKTKPASQPKAMAVVAGVTKSFGVVFILPFAALSVGLLYLRRATKGMERHLRLVAIAFFLLAISEALSLASLARNTDNPGRYNLVKAFGPAWTAEHIFLLAGVLVLGAWVWSYLTERFISQLFLIFIGMILAIYLLTTITFTFLLIRRVEDSSLNNLQTATSVLSYAIDSKKAEAKADAEAVAQDPAIVQAILNKDHKALVTTTADFLASKKQSNLVITTGNAQVLLRADNPDRWGDSISSDVLVRRALLGDANSSIVSSTGVLAPVISISSAVPILSGGNVVGTVTTSVLADNGFVDGIKSSTGLDSSIYSGDSLSATTLTAPDNQTRLIGVKLSDKAVTSKVLEQKQAFKGTVDILNRPYLTAYVPLKDVNNNVVGMLFIGQPQSSVLQDAGRSIELTFIAAAALLLASIVPAYLISRSLTKQLE